MKTLKIILFLLIGLILVGCNGEPDIDEDPIPDIIEPTLRIESLEYTIEEGQTLQLEAEILDSDEELAIIYFSNDTAIAVVSTSGLVTAKSAGTANIAIIISLYSNQKLNVTINVTEKLPEDIELAMLDFETIKTQLANEIPDVADSDVRLPYNRYGRNITWTSSNEEVISKYGFVTRGSQDAQVELTATMKYKTYEAIFKKVVTVNKMALRDISEKKISFAYAMSTNVKKEHFPQVDVVNYSFAAITVGNKFHITSNIENLVRQAHNNGTRVVAAVGGGTSDATVSYQQMALTAESRKTFIDSMMVEIEKYQLDGIDYDWEVPKASEKDLFSALVRETRAAFDAYNRDLLLTSAVSAGTWNIGAGYDVAELNKYLDYFHIMSYDLNNWPAAGTKGRTRHHTNLYCTPVAPTLSADEAITAFINAGASVKKIVLGVAAYGRAADVINPSENGLTEEAYNTAQSISFENIYELYYKDPGNSKYTLYYDPIAKASWLYSAELEVKNFISFDDERSIEAKVEYVNTKGLGGVMYWDYSNDTSGRILGFIDKYLNK